MACDASVFEDIPIFSLLDADERAVLAEVADALIPGAGRVGVAGALVDRVLAARPDLAPGLRTALAQVAEVDPATAKELAPLRYVVAAAYYLAADVLDSLAYDPQDVRSVRALDFPEYLEEGLLDHLLEAT